MCGWGRGSKHVLRLRGLLPAMMLAVAAWPSHAQLPVQTVHIDARAKATPLPHFWEQMFGSGHATLTLRADYRHDLRAVKRVTDVRYVRFHGIFDDDVGVYSEDANGKPVYNFALVDRIYDGLLRNGVRPVVEIGFMPKQLAFNPDALQAFWYHPDVSPPKSYRRWDGLVRAFARHLVQRYGIDEVSRWYFEVWNEPNIDFWNGIPRQASYFELYDHTARALKAVSPRLRVGGPATAAAAWVGAFLAHAAKDHVPVDFVSTHGYGDDTVEDLFHDDTPVPPEDRVCRAVAKVHREILASPLPHLPLLWTEWNVAATYNAQDTTYVGPALADTVRECDGMVDMMSFWTFSDVFEEQGPIPAPFTGQFGLRASGGINKPSYYDFALLHRLGHERLANRADDVIVTRRKDGTLAIAAWNLVDPGMKGAMRQMHLVLRGVPDQARVTLQRVDNEHGNVLPVYARMGSPRYPTMAQVATMNAATALPPPEQTHLERGVLTLTLEPNALVLVTVAGE